MPEIKVYLFIKNAYLLSDHSAIWKPFFYNEYASILIQLVMA